MLSNQVAIGEHEKQNSTKTILKKSEPFIIGFCKCGCGCGTWIFCKDSRGRPRRFVNHHFSRGERSNFWKGGRTVNTEGYVEIYSPSHPKAIKNRPYVREHVDVMEKHLGRYLRKGEEVHHDNEDKIDNRIENLKLMTKSDHLSYHKKGNTYRLGTHIDTSDRFCFHCGSHSTYNTTPTKENRTSYPVWNHLPHDKINWYCQKCRDRDRYLRRINNKLNS